jgi:hypothetical protein
MLFQRSINRIMIWVKRYLPAELGGITGALLSAWATSTLTRSAPMAALAATSADMVVYYAIIIIRDLRAGTHRSVRVLLRHIALEFGPAELLDSLLIRPTVLYIGITLIPNLAVGIIAGQATANLCFYVLTIISYELLSARARVGSWNRRALKSRGWLRRLTGRLLAPRQLGSLDTSIEMYPPI